MNHCLRLLLLAMSAYLGNQAQDTELVLRTQKGNRSVVAVQLMPQEGLEGDWVKVHFGDILMQDLRLSGVFLPREASARTPSGRIPAESEPGTDLVLQLKLDRPEGKEFRAIAEVLDPRAKQSVYVKQYTGGELLLRRMAHRVVDDLMARVTGVRGVADSRILFAREVSPGVKEVFQVDRDGYGARQLTRIGSLTITPSLSADGRLAFLTYKGGGPEIWGQNKDGGGFSRLYPFQSSAGLTVSTPVWSPDGKRMAFVEGDRRGNTNLKILDIDRKKVRQLTNNNGINTEPTWNPSGTQIAFTSDRDGSPQIYLMESDGSNIRKLTTEGTYNASPAWSPDGSMIAYVSRFDQGFHLFVFKLADAKSYQLTHGPGSSESPAWSPDGRFLVFSNNASGTSRLHVTDLTGNEPQLLSELTNVQSPEWTRFR